MTVIPRTSSSRSNLCFSFVPPASRVGTVPHDQHAFVSPGRPAAASPFDVTVPAGALWVLGDNRYHSRDSSQTQTLPSKGLVPIADVVGQAVLTVWELFRLAPIGSAQDTFASVPDQACPI